MQHGQQNPTIRADWKSII